MKRVASFAALGLLLGCAGMEPGPVRHDGVVSIIIVRHAETNTTAPNLPLTPAGEQRAKLLTQTVRGVKFTHAFATHTTRARQMLDEIAAQHRLKVVQLPAPGSTYEGEVVTDKTTRRAPIEPVADALRKLPPGSVAIAALNSENIYAILNRLGVPVVAGCTPGAMCVPCADNTCYPRDAYDHLWHVVLQPGQARPASLVELRYGQGWVPPR